MAITWHLYRFDYEEYLQLKPLLSVANSSESLDAIAITQNLKAVTDALINEEIDIAEARQAIVLSKCCLGEPIHLDRAFLRYLTKLRRDHNTEESAEIIGEALAGGANLESWLQPPGELLSFLTPHETKRLNQSLPNQNQSSSGDGSAPRKKANSSAFSSFTSILKRMFDFAPSSEEAFDLFSDLIEIASERNEGIVFVSVRT